MAEYSGFFNSKQNDDGTYDRIYEASDFAQYFSLMVSDGVFKDKKNKYLQVSPKDGDMKVNVSAGWGFIDGYWYHNQSDVVLEIPVNTDFSTTKQAVVLVLDLIDRQISLDVFKNYDGGGKFTFKGKKYIVLGYVTLTVGQTSIGWKDITDTRYDNLHCGAVSGLATDVDVATMFQNVKDSFDNWFNGIKGQLDTDQAGHLQLEVNDLDSRVTENTEDVAVLKKDVADAKNKLTDQYVVLEMQINIPSIEGGKTYKDESFFYDSYEQTLLEGYKPILTVVKGTGSNNIQNYYMEVRDRIGAGDKGENLHTLYTEWKNISSIKVNKATAKVNILCVKN